MDTPWVLSRDETKTESDITFSFGPAQGPIRSSATSTIELLKT